MKSEEPSPQALDKIDARLLQVLQAGGRISNLKLAEAAHLPPTAVLERVKRLTRVANMQAYREFVGSVIWALPGVRETRTYAVMEEMKNTTMLAI